MSENNFILTLPQADLSSYKHTKNAHTYRTTTQRFKPLFHLFIYFVLFIYFYFINFFCNLVMKGMAVLPCIVIIIGVNNLPQIKCLQQHLIKNLISFTVFDKLTMRDVIMSTSLVYRTDPQSDIHFGKTL